MNRGHAEADTMKLFAKPDVVMLVLGVVSVLAVTCVYENRRAVAATTERTQQAQQAQQVEPHDRGWLVAIHQNTSFPLHGKHLQVQCGSCHLRGIVAGTPVTCEACHWARRQDDPYRLQLGTHCDDCHTPQDWSRIQPGAWKHETSAGFRLEGMHGALDCTECHSTRSFRETTAACEQCHQRDFQRAQEPDHVAANFPLECDGCHFTASSWLGARFDHSTFPLAGPHRTVSCEACHLGGRFAGTPIGCVECHRAEYENSTEPNHIEAGFSIDCEECHSVDAVTWLGAEFDHEVAYPLSGMHKVIECVECHTNDVYVGTPVDCVGCHRDDYDATRDPNHRQAGLPTDCASCHGDSATSWQTASFDHNSVFPLKGMHKAAECSMCHVNGAFSGTSSECVDCHRADYNGTSSPRHAEAGFSTNCVGCHGDGAASWLGASFEHDRVFPLSGRHRAIDCIQCHVGGRYEGTPANCIACHRAEYDRTTSPNHAASGFGTECEACHGDAAASWTNATFEHDAFFTLNGNHRAAACTDCHVGGQYAGTPADCVGCHRADYDRTTSPNHAASGFSTDCASCHGTAATTWAGAGFDHDAAFRLVGNHRAAECTACHIGGRYAGTPTDCVSCHRSDYDGTRSPNHASAGFGTNCASCHGTAATTWSGASFDHDSFFALRGRHATADCTLCHDGGRYAGTPSDCVSCHRSDYDRTSSPSHAAAGFGTNCESCHGNGATSWLGATFDHNSVFPLEGAHRTLDCSTCHASGYSLPRDCYGCHASDYAATRTPNHASAGFPTTCENCHLPSHTRWTQATFNHSFPITSGAHSKFSCNECHRSSSYFEFACTACHEHAQSRMDEKHHEVGGYTYESRACYACHPNGKS